MLTSSTGTADPLTNLVKSEAEPAVPHEHSTDSPPVHRTSSAIMGDQIETEPAAATGTVLDSVVTTGPQIPIPERPVIFAAQTIPAEQEHSAMEVEQQATALVEDAALLRFRTTSGVIAGGESQPTGALLTEAQSAKAVLDDTNAPPAKDVVMAEAVAVTQSPSMTATPAHGQTTDLPPPSAETATPLLPEAPITLPIPSRPQTLATSGLAPTPLILQTPIPLPEDSSPAPSQPSATAPPSEAAPFRLPGLEDSDLSIPHLLSRPNSSFRPTPTIDVREGWDKVIAMVEDVVGLQGIPLVIQNVTQEDKWDAELFSAKWLRNIWGDNEIVTRNNDTNADVTKTMRDYIDYVCSEPELRNPPRLYGKDVVCPTEWEEASAKLLPEYFVSKGPNDLLGKLGAETPENLMIYVGFHATWTPAHKDMCGCWGHNIMVDAEDENASSIWFVAPSGAKAKVSEFWRDNKHSIDVDDYFMPVDQLQVAPFPVYVIEQKLGDFVIVPSESAHQVINKGGYTIKLSWNRHTACTLRTVYHDVLPILRTHLKSEIYRNKAVIWKTLKAWNIEYPTALTTKQITPRQLDDLGTILDLAEHIIREDWIEVHPSQPDSVLPPINRLEGDERSNCDFCKADIFNRCMSCAKCEDVDANAAPYDMCLHCYAQGRGCLHREDEDGMKFVERYSMGYMVEEVRNGSILFNRITDEMEFGDREKRKVDFGVHFEGCGCVEGVKICGVRLADAQLWSPATVSWRHMLARRVTVYSHETDGIRNRVITATKAPEEIHCHQCRVTKPTSWCVRCTTCNNNLCQACGVNRYGITSWLEWALQRNWRCHKCKGTCNCGACQRLFGTTYDNAEIVAKITRNAWWVTVWWDDPRSLGNRLDERIKLIKKDMVSGMGGGTIMVPKALVVSPSAKKKSHKKGPHLGKKSTRVKIEGEEHGGTPNSLKRRSTDHGNENRQSKRRRSIDEAAANEGRPFVENAQTSQPSRRARATRRSIDYREPGDNEGLQAAECPQPSLVVFSTPSAIPPRSVYPPHFRVPSIPQHRAQPNGISHPPSPFRNGTQTPNSGRQAPIPARPPSILSTIATLNGLGLHRVAEVARREMVERFGDESGEMAMIEEIWKCENELRGRGLFNALKVLEEEMRNSEWGVGRGTG